MSIAFVCPVIDPMRTCFSVFACLCSLAAMAQVMNGDFEAQLQDWDSTCPLSTAVSADVPPGGGQYSAHLPMLTPTEMCYLNNGIEPFLHQALPAVLNGDDLFLSYWHKAIPIDPNEAALMNSLHLFGWFDQQNVFNTLPNQGGNGPSGPWALRTTNFTVTGLPAGETLVLALAGHALGNSLGGTVAFDNVLLVVNGTVATHPLSANITSAYPLPAQQELTITTTEPILEWEMRNLSGQVVQVGARAVDPRTRVFDVGMLSAGVFILSLRSSSGTSMLRIPKH